MKNYELLLMFNASQEEPADKTVDKYKNIIANKGGSVDRYEDWGNMKLAYNINKNNKARYILMNFQANDEILKEISGLIKFNDSILRHLFLLKNKPITEPSIMMLNKDRM